MDKEQFTYDGLTVYEGQPTAYNWNGWRCPLFDELTARQILLDAGLPDQLADWPQQHGLYAIGAFSWTWEQIPH